MTRRAANMLGAVRMCLMLTCATLASSEVVPAEQGDTVVLQCPGSERDGAAEFWRDPGGTKVPVPSSDGNYISNSTSLTIRAVQETHAGEYSCHRRTDQKVTSGSIRLAVRPTDLPYWQNHGKNIGLAIVAAVGFLLACTAIYLIHRYRYERRHKTVGAANGDGFSGAHTNPALDVEAETHL